MLEGGSTDDLKILIVEDENIVATDLKQRLESMGYNMVGIVSNGKDAIKKCKETNPDLILMDIVLKGDIDGIKTAQNISKHYNIPHIYITGNYDNTIMKKAKTTQPISYITKPFDDKGIQNTIEMAFIKHYKK
jgi:CheY-like chemotaxis protein